MNSLPLVSICVPVFNGDRFLRKTLTSLLSQSHTNLEVLISDHCSSDRSVEIISSFTDPRIKCRSLDRDRSAADNWNACTQGSSGKYIKIIGQDDLLSKDCIESQVKLLERNDLASFCFSPRNIISPKGFTVLKSRGFKPQNSSIRIEDFLADLVRSGTNFFGEPCAVLIRKHALDNAGDFVGNYLIDLDMWIRLWTLGPAQFDPQTTSSFRISKSSWSSALSGDQLHQTEVFFNQVMFKFPELLQDSDVIQGLKRANLLSYQRRALNSLVEFLHI